MGASYSARRRTPSRYRFWHGQLWQVQFWLPLGVLLGLLVLGVGSGATLAAQADAEDQVPTRQDNPSRPERSETQPAAGATPEAAADEAAASESEDYPSPDEAVLPLEQPPQLPEPIGMERLSKTDRAWIDAKRNRVVVDGRVSLRQGVLEMFACPRNTKEHESVVAVDAKAFVLHAALLAVGAETGGPAQFVPAYRPPHGTQINVEVFWLDKEGKRQKAKAQEWVRDLRTKQQMTLPWVFAGSGFWLDEETGKQYYQAEAGDLICVSNFSTAMLDVPAESTNVNDGLFFEAFTERIPPLGTPVRVVLSPVLPKQEEPASPEPQVPATTTPPRVGLGNP